jgi:uncharacterized protein with LGFP repeats
MTLSATRAGLRQWSLAMLVAVVAASSASAQPAPWDTPEGRACIDRWAGEAAARLNRHNGDANFNSRKPYSFNQYGLVAMRGMVSSAPPDFWEQYGRNRHRVMWENAEFTAGFGPRWPPWQAAGIPPLKGYVTSCVGTAAGGGAGGGAPSPPGTACGYTLLPPTLAKWHEVGGASGVLGCPTKHEGTAGSSPAGSGGNYVPLAKGTITRATTGPAAGHVHGLWGEIDALYKSLGGTMSFLGFALSDVYAVPEGSRADFEGGYILFSTAAGSAKAFKGSATGPAGGGATSGSPSPASGVGTAPSGAGPAAAGSGAASSGAGVASGTGTAAAGAGPVASGIAPAAGAACDQKLSAPMLEVWNWHGGRAGILGCPTSSDRPGARSPLGTEGAYVQLERGILTRITSSHRAGQVHEIHGEIHRAYMGMGGSGSTLGWPISDVYPITGGYRADFEGGSMLLDSSTGRTAVAPR